MDYYARLLSAAKNETTLRQGVDVMRKRLYFVVEGLFEKSDSIGFDCAYQFNFASRNLSDRYEVALVTDRFEKAWHPNLDPAPVDHLLLSEESFKDTTIIYHFCDGWPRFESWLERFDGTLIVRWHNNTPPWFYAHWSRRSAERSIRGYKAILDLAAPKTTRIWCNSEFSVKQLEVLGVPRAQSTVVYPASRYLERDDVLPPGLKPDLKLHHDKLIRLVFVGRVVAHKGHQHVVSIAALVQKTLNVPVQVVFPGRLDSSISDYVEQIREQASRLDVDLDIPGEIDEEHLTEIYKSATALVCASEHEGFGLPVYEAMNLQIPVVAWAITAIEELLAEHPLSTTEFDLCRLAAGVIASTDERIRAHVVDWQNRNVLTRYTKEIVAQQIVEGLADPEGIPAPIRAGTVARSAIRPDDMLQLGRISIIVDEIMAGIDRRLVDSLSRNIVHEIPNNFVTRYDIDSYSSFLVDVFDLVPGRAGPTTTANADPTTGLSRGLHVKASRFSAPGSVRVGDDYCCRMDADLGHIVFGPYIKLPPGRFQVEFDFDCDSLISDPRLRGEIHFDVCEEGARLLAHHVLRLKDLNSKPSCILEFDNRESSAPLEFRISCVNCPPGDLVFHGVFVSRLPPVDGAISTLLDQLAKGPYLRTLSESMFTYQIPVFEIGLGRFTIGLAGGMAIRPHRKTSPTKTSQKYFDKAAEARDRRDWTDAVHFYELGLRHDPNNVAMLAQFGNVLKEAGFLFRAEQAYRDAIRLKPNDAGVHLLLAHLMKVQGRRFEAMEEYICAAALERSGAIAIRELEALGAPAEMLSSL